MTPGQARGALASFLLVMVGVAVNALYLQARSASGSRAVADRAEIRPIEQTGSKVSRPAVAQGGAQEQSLRIARFAADPPKIGRTSALADETASVDTIRAIQRELKLRGYGPITGDGAMTLSMRAGIMAFEHDNGMALSGEASDRLLKRILLGAADPASIDNSAAGRVRSPHAEQIVRDVQQRLGALGYQPGSINGRPDEDTTRAIRDFEMDRGLVPRGRVSAELVARLHEATASMPTGR
jgi:peptidoglycan hydrolase-like protein with peptidoglycan-binding domain